jgi:DNA-binding response OmpR family regulator
MKKREILVVEHETAIAEAIKSRLETHDEFSVDIVSTGYGALRSIGASVPDAVLLDATLTDMTGSELCRLIRSRERTAHLPMIILGDRSNGLGPIEWLELGADDYVTKPLDPHELEARLNAVLRRRLVHHQYPEEDRFDGVHLEANFSAVSIVVDGCPVRLTKREFLLLRCLVHNRNHIVSRDRLLANVWGSDVWNRRIVDAAVWKLRTKLKQAGHQIETVVGFGYRFNESPK